MRATLAGGAIEVAARVGNARALHDVGRGEHGGDDGATREDRAVGVTVARGARDALVRTVARLLKAYVPV